jgi:hypothetical protein
MGGFDSSTEKSVAATDICVGGKGSTSFAEPTPTGLSSMGFAPMGFGSVGFFSLLLRLGLDGVRVATGVAPGPLAPGVAGGSVVQPSSSQPARCTGQINPHLTLRDE